VWKKWFHKSMCGSTPMWSSHRVTKAGMCKIPEGVK
jgi:hypothetical protein